MNQKLIYLLQDIISEKNDALSASQLLDLETKTLLCNWYLKYTNSKEADILIILDLLCFLYLKHDIDVTIPTIYLDTLDFLVQKYNIKRDTFLNMLTDFRTLIF